MLLTILGHQYDKKQAVKAAIEHTTASMNAEYDKKLREAKDQAQEIERQLQKEKDEALKRKDNEIKAIDDQLDSALSSLQFYKQCSSSTTAATDTSIGIPCPGAELSNEDARFLVKEAARADKVVKERDYYYERYENARRSLETRKETTVR